jgi:hypothetical protein
VGRGYLRRPELTAARFLNDPFDPWPGARLYETGDFARFRADGNIEFLGRIGHQVKLRGSRVELAEVEAQLSSHPGVRQAVAVVGEDGRGEKTLVAYWVPRQDPVPAAALRGFLKQRLPHDMAPSRFQVIDELPQTASGKIDRESVPKLEKIQRPHGPMGPRDRLETSLVRVWEQVPGVRPVGVTDSFFDLGGHSLLAIRLLRDVELFLGRRLPSATLFESPTVEQLARILRDESWQPNWSSLAPIQPCGSKPPLFCVHAVHGNVLFYAPLARELGSDQPVYGLQSIGLDGRTPPLEWVEPMAAAYLAEMRTVQPEGPYYLGGFCSGANVALEMAIQLRDAGADAALLAAFNTDGGWKSARSLGQGLSRLSLEESFASGGRQAVELCPIAPAIPCESLPAGLPPRHLSLLFRAQGATAGVLAGATNRRG